MKLKTELPTHPMSNLFFFFSVLIYRGLGDLCYRYMLCLSLNNRQIFLNNLSLIPQSDRKGVGHVRSPKRSKRCMSVLLREPSGHITDREWGHPSVLIWEVSGGMGHSRVKSQLHGCQKEEAIQSPKRGHPWRSSG